MRLSAIERIETLATMVPALIVEDRILDVTHTLLATRLKEIVWHEIPLSFNAGPNPRFQDARYYIFSHWTINGVLQDPTQYPTVRVTTGSRQRVTAWWRDAGSVWPPPVDNTPSSQEITVYAVSAQKGPLLNTSDEIPLFNVDPASARVPASGRTISTRRIGETSGLSTSGKGRYVNTLRGVASEPAACHLSCWRPCVQSATPPDG
jgi:hypothetical protein